MAVVFLVRCRTLFIFLAIYFVYIHNTRRDSNEAKASFSGLFFCAVLLFFCSGVLWLLFLMYMSSCLCVLFVVGTSLVADTTMAGLVVMVDVGDQHACVCDFRSFKMAFVII